LNSSDSSGGSVRRPVLVMVAMAFALGGCGEDAPAADPPASSPAPPVESASAGFVDVVRAKLPDIAVDRRDEELQAVADRACAALADGTGADAIVAETRSLGTPDAEATDQATARELVKLAIDTTCPDQDRRVDEF
jgi:predicted small lipoprotein YifL